MLHKHPMHHFLMHDHEDCAFGVAVIPQTGAIRVGAYLEFFGIKSLAVNGRSSNVVWDGHVKESQSPIVVFEATFAWRSPRDDRCHHYESIMCTEPKQRWTMQPCSRTNAETLFEFGECDVYVAREVSANKDGERPDLWLTFHWFDSLPTSWADV